MESAAELRAAPAVGGLSGQMWRNGFGEVRDLWEASGGRTLHQLRHSRLTHLAEAGTETTILRAISRHSSLRTLDRYVNPGPDTVAAALDAHPPGATR